MQKFLTFFGLSSMLAGFVLALIGVADLPQGQTPFEMPSNSVLMGLTLMMVSGILSIVVPTHQTTPKFRSCARRVR